MEEHILRQGEEWGGHKPSKFLRTKKHVEQEISIDPQYKQIFDTSGRKHYQAPGSDEFKWKPSVKQINFDSQHEVKKPSQIKIVNKVKFRNF